LRILGGLRHRLKLTFLFLCLLGLSFSSQELQAQEAVTSYEDLLSIAFEQSSEYQKISAQLDVETIDAQSLLAMYNWTLSGGVNRIDAERPITNPFAPNKQLTTSYNLRLEKNNLSGINPFVELQSDDAGLSFPDGRSATFQTATIEAGVRVDVIRALLLKNSTQAFSEAETKKELAEVSQKVAKQKFATRVSQAFYKALRSHRALSILKTQCSEYSKLQSISSRRFKRKLIQEQDYLTIEVLYQNCLLDKKTAENNKKMDELALLKVAGLSLETKLNLDKVKFLTLPSLAAGPQSESSLSNNLDLKFARAVLKASSQSAAALKSDLLPEVDFSYSLKSEAAGTSIGNSLGEAGKFDLLTHGMGLNLTYEFGESAARLAAKRAQAFQSVKKYELAELESSLKRDSESLSQNILYLRSGLAQAQSLVKLQERKARLFRKDFANGRGGIRDLVEAQISYLSSLERSLLFQFNLSAAYLDLKQIKGEQIDKIN